MAALGGEGKSPFSSSSSDCDYFLRSFGPPPKQEEGERDKRREGGGRTNVSLPVPKHAPLAMASSPLPPSSPLLP